MALKEMRKMDRLILYYNEAPLFGSVISFNMKGTNSFDLGYILQHGYGIIARSGYHCCPLIHAFLRTSESGCLRISFSCFTQEDEIKQLISALNEIKKSLHG